MPGRSMRLILNDGAARDEGVREAVDALRSRGHDVDVRVIWEAGQAEVFATEAVRQGIDVVVAGGGDGTLNEVTGAVCRAHQDEPGAAVGVLPFGTANDFAAACGIPLDDPLAALALAAEEEPTPIDVGRANDRLFVNVASGGYGATVTAETSPEVKKLLGRTAYFIAGIAHVADLDARRARVVAPNFEWEGVMMGIAVANGRRAGGGFQVAPDALLDDGLLDVSILPEIPMPKLMMLVKEMRAENGDAVTDQLITVRVPWLEMDAPEGLHVNLDGEPFEGTSFRFEVLARHLRCCLPSTAPLAT